MPLIVLLTSLSGVFGKNGPVAGAPLFILCLYFSKICSLLPEITAFSQLTTSIFSPSNAFLATSVAILPNMRLVASTIIFFFHSVLFFPFYFYCRGGTVAQLCTSGEV